MEYKYKATVVSVYDGDTITVNIDLGFGVILQKKKIRLYGINTPEVRGEERERGLVSRDYLRELIDGKEIILETIRDKTVKYGRYLGIIHFDIIDELVNVNELLVTEGLAVEAQY